MKRKILTILILLSPITVLAQEINKQMLFSTSEFFEAQYSNRTHWAEDSMTFELGIFENNIPTLSDVLSGSGFDWTPIPLQESTDPTLPGDVGSVLSCKGIGVQSNPLPERTSESVGILFSNIPNSKVMESSAQ